MNRTLATLAAVSLTALACQGGHSPGDAGPGLDAGADAGPPLVADAVYASGTFTVDAGGEIVMCTFVQGTNDAEEDISKFVTEQSAGGHHLIVYTLNHPVNLPPTVCPQGGQPGWDYLFGTQDQHDEWDLPAGVGFHLQAHQQFAIETHYINATPQAITVSGAFGLDYAPAGSVTQRASVFYFGTENLNLAPGQAKADVYCSPPDPIEIQAIVGHEHRFGTGVTVGLVADGGPEQPIYETQQWDAPPFLHLDGGLAVGTHDALHISCDWDNTTASPLTFPTEMCFAVGAYWPSQALLFCSASGGTSPCYCGYGIPLDTGPGGASVPVSVSLQGGFSGVVGNPTDGAPIYCALYRQQDWNGLQPTATAQAYYVDYVTGIALSDGNATAKMTFVDVTPGDYVATCFMDTIAGGSTPGTGDPTNLGGQLFTAVAGDNPVVPVVLDYAIP